LRFCSTCTLFYTAQWVGALWQRSLTDSEHVLVVSVGVIEWRSGRTPGYRRADLRVVRRSDGRPIGLGRSLLREVCCALLLLPTLVACCFLALGLVMGASPPGGMFAQSRHAPWDLLTRTEVVNEAP
jgi:hypothetical protein